MLKLNIRREDIGNCRGCKVSTQGVTFKGRVSEHCTHLHTDCGWWLRIKHKWDYFTASEEPLRLLDIVGELLCPVCMEEYNKRMEEFIGEL